MEEKREIKYNGGNSLSHLFAKLTILFSKKVDKVDGKGLSQNDFTDELKEKLLNAGDSTFTGNYNDLTNKPTKLSEFVNDSNFQTDTQVNVAIANALKNIQGISYSIVETLPVTGEAGVIYLISNNGANPNSYDEYIWITDKFEKIGTTEVDLTGYVKESDLVEITNEEIDALFDAVFSE